MRACQKALAALPAPRSLRALKTACGIDTLRVATKTALTIAVALVVLLFAFASVSPLHDESHRHDDSTAADHACVMCAFAKSQLTGAEPAPVLAPCAAAAAAPTLSPLAVSVELPTSDHPLPPGRAPPVV